MAGLSTENSVKAKTHNQPAFEEGEALEALEPGQGVVRGNGGLEAAGTDSKTKQVVREQRNPGSRGVEDFGTSPFDYDYAVGDNVETLGFQSHDEARLLVAYGDVDGDASDDTYTQGTDLGWNANGYLESVNGGPTEAVAYIEQEDSVTMSSGDDPTIVRVKFY